MEQKHILIRRCEAGDAEMLLAMIAQEGDAWKEYSQGAGRKKYLKALSRSLAWLLFDINESCLTDAMRVFSSCRYRMKKPQ